MPEFPCIDFEAQHITKSTFTTSQEHSSANFSDPADWIISNGEFYAPNCEHQIFYHNVMMNQNLNPSNSAGFHNDGSTPFSSSNYLDNYELSTLFSATMEENSKKATYAYSSVDS